MIGFFIALISGALMSIQGVFNTKVTDNSSMWAANTFVQFTAFIVCFAAWLMTDRTSFKEDVTARKMLGNKLMRFFVIGDEPKPIIIEPMPIPEPTEEELKAMQEESKE